MSSGDMLPATKVLREHGKPMEATQFADEIVSKLSITTRQAKRNIKKAVDSGEIRKIPLPDRRVLYALPEWSISKNFQDAFYYFGLKELEQIAIENVYGRHLRAFQRLRHLIARQPRTLQDKLAPMLTKVIKIVEDTFKTTRDYNQRQEVIREVTLGLISELSILLHEQLEKEAP